LQHLKDAAAAVADAGKQSDSAAHVSVTAVEGAAAGVEAVQKLQEAKAQILQLRGQLAQTR
jgi:hypothetical protein